MNTFVEKLFDNNNMRYFCMKLSKLGIKFFVHVDFEYIDELSPKADICVYYVCYENDKKIIF